MTNKIHGYGQPQLPATRGDRVSSNDNVARSDSKPVQPAQPARDSVSVSEDAILLKRLEESVAKAPATSAEQVRQIKDALSRGEYTVDAQRVADKILKAERELDRNK